MYFTMKTHLFFLIVWIGILLSCHDKVRSKETSGQPISKQEKLSLRVQGRKAKGDTLAMPYKELAQFMPTNIAGYKPLGEPAGQAMTMQGVSYSSYEQIFENASRTVLRIQLTDYNASEALLNIATLPLSEGFEVENSRILARKWPVDWKDTTGYEEFQKEDKEAKVTLRVADRFLIQISADHQKNTDFVKTIAQSMNIQQLINY